MLWCVKTSAQLSCLTLGLTFNSVYCTALLKLTWLKKLIIVKMPMCTFDISIQMNQIQFHLGLLSGFIFYDVSKHLYWLFKPDFTFTNFLPVKHEYFQHHKVNIWNINDQRQSKGSSLITERKEPPAKTMFDLGSQQQLIIRKVDGLLSWWVWKRD